MGPRCRFYPYLYILHILGCLGQDMQVLYLGRAPRTKETLPHFLKWRWVTRLPRVFRGLTGSQRTLGFWGVTPGRGRGRGTGGRGSTPIGQIQSSTHTQARVFTITQHEADASLDVITGMISIYDHDAYALVDPRSHSFIYFSTIH